MTEMTDLNWNELLGKLGAKPPTPTQTPLEKALHLASLGVHVFPCKQDKTPLTRSGHLDATTDPEAIATWWGEHPSALVGYATGASGLVVLDIDVKPHGLNGYQSLWNCELDYADSVTYTTPSGGQHVVYKAPAGVELNGQATFKGLPGVDRRAGSSYAIWYGDAPTFLNVDVAPEWLVTARPASATAPAGSYSGDLDVWKSWLEGGSGFAYASSAMLLDIMNAKHIGHDSLRKYLFKIHRLRMEGEAGLLHVFETLQAVFYKTTNEEPSDARREFDQLLRGAIGEEWEPTDPPTAEPVDPSAPAPESRGLKIVREDELLSRPAPEWFVEDLIQQGTVGIVAGEGGIGKSFLMLHMARCVAAGIPFFGKDVKQGRVLYVAAEGASSFGARIAAWNRRHAVIVPSENLGFIESGVMLTHKESVEDLKNTVVSEEIDIVILDTFSQLAAIDNENDAAEIANVMRTAREIREARPGSTVLLVHHVNKAGGKVRGSSVIKDNADTVLKLYSSESSDGFSLTTDASKDGKQKDGQPVTMHGFSLEPVLDSAVVTYSGKSPTSEMWADVKELLLDGSAHAADEVREAAGIDRDDKAAIAKFQRQMKVWVERELVLRTGGGSSVKYTLTELGAES